MSESHPPPGWYADPSGPVAGSGPAGLRYWDGRLWTEHRAGAPGTGAYGAGSSGTGSYGAGPATGTDGFAIAAFVLGLVGVIPLAVVFGILALVRIGRTRRGGKGFAIAGLVLAGVWVLVIGAGIALAAAGHQLDRTSPGRIAQSELRVGDCVQLPRVVPDQPRSFAAKRCRDPHNGEVYQVAAVPPGDYPGESAMADQVLGICQDALDGFLGGDASQSPLHVVYIYPTPRSWKADDRTYVCIAVDRQRDVTGSMGGQLGGT